MRKGGEHFHGHDEMLTKHLLDVGGEKVPLVQNAKAFRQDGQLLQRLGKSLHHVVAMTQGAPDLAGRRLHFHTGDIFQKFIG